MQNKTAVPLFFNSAVILVAAAIGIFSQYQGLMSEYVINGDVPQHIYWMHQFIDKDLFKNDILTHFAIAIQPWGFAQFYHLLSCFADPLILSKTVPVFLFILSALYMFKLVQYLGGNFSGVLASSLFMVMPVFLTTIAGGTSRAFAYPLLIMFLYYLLRRERLKASVLLILQVLFYPMVFFVSLLTFLLTNIEIRNKPIQILFDRKHLKFSIVAAVIGISILAGKYFLDYDPSLGTIVTRDQMEMRQEFSENGRAPILPTPSLREALIGTTAGHFLGFILKSPLYLRIRNLKPAFLDERATPFIMLSMIAAIGFLLVVQIKRLRRSVRIELLYLAISSVIMFEIADFLLFRLYIPKRYLSYSFFLLSLIIFALTIGGIVASLRSRTAQMVLSFTLIFFVLLQFSSTKGLGLTDQSEYKNLYIYLSTLPKDTVIASHPYIADYIPTFSKRKVFINFELSLPWFDRYWETVKERTLDFLNAYYTDNIQLAWEFCQRHEIEYLVVDKRHFTHEYLEAKRIYFEPFDEYIREITQNRMEYALLNTPEGDHLFHNGDIFVIRTNALIQ
jgi:hypothetical protein